MVYSGINDVAFTSVYFEKTHLKKLMTIIIMNKLQETTVFNWPEIDFRYEIRPEKGW